MADDKQLNLICKGTEVWNNWRKEHPTVYVDLSRAKLIEDIELNGADLREATLREAWLRGANLRKADLRGANLSDADLTGADLTGANLIGASLRGANLTRASLKEACLSKVNLNEADLSFAKLNGARLNQARLDEAYLYKANLSGANLSGAEFRHARLIQANLLEADLSGANLTGANLIGADLSRAKLNGAQLFRADCYQTNFSYADLTGANLQNASLVETNLEGVTLTNCKIYGLSAWALKGTLKEQGSLIITPDEEAVITVDDLQVAQFIYLLLNRESLRNVIDTITSKAVLILGRFTPERKVILDAMADELRKHNLLPIIFDFERPSSRDFTETIKTLAGLCLFVIADITNPKSAPLELQATIPDYQIPFVPIIQEGELPFSMASDLMKYDWVLTPVITYRSKDDLLKGFKAIIDIAWKKHQELQSKKTATIKTQSIEDFAKNAG